MLQFKQHDRLTFTVHTDVQQVGMKWLLVS